jgi:hypothetical protein
MLVGPDPANFFERRFGTPMLASMARRTEVLAVSAV